MPFTSQWTELVRVPDTVAAKDWVCPACTVTAAGNTRINRCGSRVPSAKSKDDVRQIPSNKRRVSGGFFMDRFSCAPLDGHNITKDHRPTIITKDGAPMTSRLFSPVHDVSLQMLTNLVISQSQSRFPSSRQKTQRLAKPIFEARNFAAMS
jgi:hypothetical protein